MQIEELPARLAAIGVGRWHYSIGADQDERFCVVRPEGERWHLYFRLRGEKQDTIWAFSEDEACQYTLDRFTRLKERYVKYGLDLRDLARDH
ncbi:hypothetical protein AB0B28_02350 [Glycomyces sp. NPDC046736]|uniref:hypothetical protein n=1 Tax=Glycomyces sp. NPDC046736 TaxID=3155615 RepID=UPI0033C613F5